MEWAAHDRSLDSTAPRIASVTVRTVSSRPLTLESHNALHFILITIQLQPLKIAHAHAAGQASPSSEFVQPATCSCMNAWKAAVRARTRSQAEDGGVTIIDLCMLDDEKT
jgi:hypothetical protein